MSLEVVEAARRRFLLVLAGLLPLALAGAAAGGWFLAGRALAPVDAMVETARRIGAEDLSRRLTAETTDDELGRLAAVLNDMLDRLERSFTAARQFSADAAHELRTPLTILRGELEVALAAAPADAAHRRALESCLEEVDRLSSLVEDLLFLARADAGADPPPAEPVDLAAVVADAAPALEALAARAGVRLDIAVRPGAPARGSAPCSSASSSTWPRTPSSTAARAPGSGSAPGRTATRPSSRCATTDPGSRPRIAGPHLRPLPPRRPGARARRRRPRARHHAGHRRLHHGAGSPWSTARASAASV